MTLDILRNDPMGAREPGEPGNLRKPYEMVCRVVFTYIELMLSGFLVEFTVVLFDVRPNE